MSQFKILGLRGFTVFQCDRDECKHVWIAEHKPKRCAKCKSPYWDKFGQRFQIKERERRGLDFSKGVRGKYVGKIKQPVAESVAEYDPNLPKESASVAQGNRRSRGRHQAEHSIDNREAGSSSLPAGSSVSSNNDMLVNDPKSLGMAASPRVQHAINCTCFSCKPPKAER